jgi:hypothetical protein
MFQAGEQARADPADTWAYAERARLVTEVAAIECAAAITLCFGGRHSGIAWRRNSAGAHSAWKARGH